MYKRPGIGAALALLSILLCLATAAGAASPSLSLIQPRGAVRGGDIELQLHGGDLSDAVDLFVHDPGITLNSITAESDNLVKAVVTIAPDCAPGVKALRVRTRTGITNPRLFSVGLLAEVAETEPNNIPDQAQAVALNTTVNGMVPAEDVDYYALELAPEERLAVEVEAIRLGDTLFDPKLRLFDPAGLEQVSEDDTTFARQDAAFVYVAKAAGRHLLAVSEAAYGGGGNCFYRLHVGTFPRPFSATPWGGKPGASIEVRWLGDPGLATQAVTLPDLPPQTFALAVQSDRGTAPTPLAFRVTPLEQTLELEPNNELAAATAGPAPGAFEGVLQEDGDVDFFRFDGTKDSSYEFRVWARELGSPVDSVLTLHKPSGEAIASDDDAAAIDSVFRASLPEDGAYTLSVRDHRMRGGPTYAYRLEVSPVVPRLSYGTPENKSVALTVHQNNHAFLLLTASRQDFGGALTTAFESLPQGLTAAFDPFADGVGSVPVVFTAAADAPMAGALAAVAGASEDGAVKGGLAQSLTLVEGPPNRTIYLSRVMDRLAVAVGEPAPFSVAIVAPKTPIVRGGAKPIRIVATRAEGFNEPIALAWPWMPPGLGAPSAKIEQDQSEVVIRLEAKADAAPGAQKLVVEAASAGYSVCSDFTPVSVEEPWVVFAVPQVETEQGKPVELVVPVTHAKPFEGQFAVSLYGLPKGVSTPEQQLTKDAPELRFPLTVAEDAPPGKHGGLGATVTIVAEEEELAHYFAGGELTIHKPLPPKLQEAQPEPAPEEKPEERPASRFAQN